MSQVKEQTNKIDWGKRPRGEPSTLDKDWACRPDSGDDQHLQIGYEIGDDEYQSRERRPDRSSLMWSRPIPSPWHRYKDDLMKLNLQTVSFAAEALRMLNGARLSVS